MAMGAVRVQGLRELQRALKKIPGDLEVELKVLHRDAAEQVMRAAIPLVPERTGRLKRTVRALASKRTGRVAAGYKAVPYAGPIHFGWPDRGIRPQPFLTDALEAERDKVTDNMRKGLDRITLEAMVKSNVRMTP